jgi:hypothetical protein
MNDLQQLLISGKPLYITIDGFRQAMIEAFPLTGEMQMPDVQNKLWILTPEHREFLNKHSWYQLETREALKDLLQALSQEDEQASVSITTDFDSEELPENSIAYHRVWGTIMSDSYWYFSSKQLELDLLAAEANPQITCHFLHINSPGGAAWYLDRLSETLRNCEKPIITLYEQMCCSAGYYIGCHGEKVYALTANDYVGCIGTMCSFYNFKPYFEKLGIKYIESKADKSDLKNKTFDDLEKGEDKKFVDDFLNPLNEQFLSEVRSQRSKLAEQDENAPVLRGETFYSSEAMEIGLNDGMRTLSEVIAEAVSMGAKYSETKNLKSAIYSII